MDGQELSKAERDKTEIMVFRSTHQRRKFSLENVPIGSFTIVPSSKVRNLGVVHDWLVHGCSCEQDLLFCPATPSWDRSYSTFPLSEDLWTPRACFCHIKVEHEKCPFVWHYWGKLHRLQRIQNSAVRLVTKLGRHKHITPVLRHLHWLPVRQRIIYKILLQVHRLAPKYIAELVHTHVPLSGSQSADDLGEQFLESRSTHLELSSGFCQASRLTDIF